MAPVIQPYDADVVPASGNVVVDEMRAYGDGDDLDVLEKELRSKVENTVVAWLNMLPEDAAVYEALTAKSAGLNALSWERGIVVEEILNHASKTKYLRVARSFYTTDPVARAKQKILELRDSLSTLSFQLQELLEVLP